MCKTIIGLLAIALLAIATPRASAQGCPAGASFTGGAPFLSAVRQSGGNAAQSGVVQCEGIIIKSFVKWSGLPQYAFNPGGDVNILVGNNVNGPFTQFDDVTTPTYLATTFGPAECNGTEDAVFLNDSKLYVPTAADIAAGQIVFQISAPFAFETGNGDIGDAKTTITVKITACTTADPCLTPTCDAASGTCGTTP